MKTLFTLLFTFGSLPAFLSAGTQVELPKGATLILPEGITADWVLPPAKEAPSTAGKEIYFTVDPNDGLVWLGLEKSAVYVPQKNALMRTKAPFSQIVWLGNGEQVVSDAAAIGRFTAPAAKSKGLPVLGFKPAFTFSAYKRWTMAPAGKDTLYVTGQKKETKRFRVLLFGPGAGGGKRPFRVLYETDAPILAVAGDGEDTYISMGKEVFKYRSKGRDLKAAFIHPDKKIEQLEFAPGGGFFYATGEGVGYVGGKEAFEFLRYPRCRMRLAGGSLYILLGDLPDGVLRIKGASRFSGASFPAKKKTP